MRALVCLSLALLLGLPLLAQTAREPYIVVSGEWTLPISVDGTRLTGTNSNTWASVFLTQPANEGLRSWLSAKEITYSRETYDGRSYQSDPNANVSIVTNWIRDRNPSATFQVSEVTKSSTKFSFRSSVSLGEIPGLIPLYQARWLNLGSLATFLTSNIQGCSFRVGNNNTPLNSDSDRILVRDGNSLIVRKRGARRTTPVGGNSMDRVVLDALKDKCGNAPGAVIQDGTGRFTIPLSFWNDLGYSEELIKGLIRNELERGGAEDRSVGSGIVSVTTVGSNKVIRINYPTRQRVTHDILQDTIAIQADNNIRYNNQSIRLNPSLLSEFHYDIPIRPDNR